MRDEEEFESHLDDDVLHVIVVLGVEEGSELLSGGDEVPVPVGDLESPLVSLQHGLVAGFVINVIKLLTCGSQREHGLQPQHQEILTH